MKTIERSSRWLLASVCGLVLVSSTMAAPSRPFDAAARAEILAATPEADVPYLVQLESRLLLPRGPVEAVSLRGEKVFVQFAATLTREQREVLEAAGVVFHESLEPFTYLVSASGAGASALQRETTFLGAAPIEPTDKVTASIFTGNILEHARRPDGQVAAFFRFYANITLAEALATLDGAGVSVSDRSAFLFGNRIEGTATPAQILIACTSPALRAVFEVPPTPVISNVQAAGFSAVPPVQIAPYNLNGSGVAVGVWDQGSARATHQDLSPRVTVRQGVPLAHGTHVTGTIMGSGFGSVFAKGMATAATSFSYDFQGDMPTEQSASATFPIPVGGDGIALSNNSWENNFGWRPNCPSGSCTMHNDPNCFYEDIQEFLLGSYIGNTIPWDDLVRRKNLVVVKSAGNQADDCGPADCLAARNTDCDGTLGSDGLWYDNLDFVSTAKNVITVGAVEDDGVTRTPFSSSGPVDDGRIKPDVVANGRNLNSTGAAADNDYYTDSGTSMSGPVVAGVVALVDQAWKNLHPSRSSAINKPTPELVKALLINTTTDLGRGGPDYAYGWGLVKAQAAIDQLQKPNAPGGILLSPNQVRIGFISEGETLYYKVSTPAATPTGLMTITTAWSDLSGTSGSVVRYCNFVNFKVPCTSNANCTPFNPAAVCDPAPCGAVPCHLKNDLETWLWNPAFNSAIAMPWVPPGVGAITGGAFNYLNRVDNVERIDTSDANGGDFNFTVFGFTVGEGQQRFALVSNKKLIFLPGNDNFANARALPAMVAADPAAGECPSGQFPCPATLYPHNTWDSVNFDATLEAGEPASIPPLATSHSVWFNFVAPSNGQLTFDTAGADFDTVLSVWTGSTLAGLTSVGSNDDFYGKQSQVTFNAVAGTTYRVQVRGRTPAGGAQDVSEGVFPLNYYLIVCGNSVTEAGETCDDGNSTSGDCCSSTCQLAAGGSTCSPAGDLCQTGTCSGATCTGIGPTNCNDSNVCTNDSCSPATGCAHVNNNGPCDDGNVCTGTDFCSFGACVSGTPLAYPTASPNLVMTSQAHLSWSAPPRATEYDIVRGDLGTLRTSGGNFTTATVECVADNQISTQRDYIPNPTAGNGFYFLVRGVNCSGSGTYDTGSPSQNGSRDTEVEAAAVTCSTVCSRGKCTTGPPLDPGCSPCVVSICNTDAFCCNTNWDNQCISEVRTICNSLTCPESAGSCAHPVCTIGNELVSGCDNPPVNPSCVAAICAADPFCCLVDWDGPCVSQVVSVCGKNCN